jgi:hypothetical protein
VAAARVVRQGGHEKEPAELDEGQDDAGEPGGDQSLGKPPTGGGWGTRLHLSITASI